MQKIAVTIRIDPAVQKILKECALRERRSSSNMIEVMILEYGKHLGIDEAEKESDSESSRKAI